MITESAVTAKISENGPTSTGSRATLILGIVTVIALGVLVLFGLILSPADQKQGDAVRIMYVHVPSATLSYIGCLLAGVGSAVFLWRKSQWWDLVAYAGAEVAALFTAFTLVTGMFWGRPTWGVFWVWDARLTSSAMLMLLLLGYLAVRRLEADYSVRAKRAAIVGLLLVPNVFIVRQSVQWWRTLHQTATLQLGDTKLDGLMLFSLFTGFVATALAFVWMVIHRFRVAWLEEQVDTEGLDAALVERRAEGVAST
ncbi:MAG: cytochrome c biogenesis protein CcsA [Acidimicrobiales bacterium]